jgi:hypothetical protein
MGLSTRPTPPPSRPRASSPTACRSARAAASLLGSNENDSEGVLFDPLPKNATTDDLTASVTALFGASVATAILKAYPVRRGVACMGVGVGVGVCLCVGVCACVLVCVPVWACVCGPNVSLWVWV